jgi:hypothetical protein
MLPAIRHRTPAAAVTDGRQTRQQGRSMRPFSVLFSAQTAAPMPITPLPVLLLPAYAAAAGTAGDANVLMQRIIPVAGEKIP